VSARGMRRLLSLAGVGVVIAALLPAGLLGYLLWDLIGTLSRLDSHSLLLVAIGFTVGFVGLTASAALLREPLHERPAPGDVAPPVAAAQPVERVVTPARRSPGRKVLLGAAVAAVVVAIARDARDARRTQ
jgi:hypothetical protein